MSPNSLQLIIEIACKPERLAEVEERALLFVEQTRSVPGCEDAKFFEVNEDPERFVFIAWFEDMESLETYFEASWRQETAALMSDLLAEPPRRFTMKLVA
jgi:quinol monooxygenase YgiN